MAREPSAGPPPAESGIEKLLARALAHFRAGRLDDSEALFREALAQSPAHAAARQSLGTVLAAKGDPEAALVETERALEAKPDFPEALSGLGNILRQLGRPEEALASYDRALAIRPGYAGALLNRGNVLIELNRPEEALASYDSAIAVRPDYVEAYGNRGNALKELRRAEAGLASYARAREIRPGDPEARFGEAVLRLATGDFERGFPLFEARWQQASLAPDRRAFDGPPWLGGDEIAGRTLLVYAEQGIGDTIQFCRFAPLVAAMGARVVLEVQPQLRSLMASLAGVERVLGRGDALPSFDAHCPLLSLPLALGTTIETVPAARAYLEAPVERVAAWREALGRRQGPRVGLAWAGNPAHSNDRNRSMPAGTLAPLLGSGVELITLQREMSADDRAWLAANPAVRAVGAGLGDMGDVAGLISQLDLVVSVDTAAAHLAGALGKPAWILLPYFGVDWRWMWSRDDSPWYPSTRLFRQSGDGLWEPVVASVARELKSMSLRGSGRG